MPEAASKVKARIKRASARSRRSMDRLDAEALRDLTRIYRQARADIEATILGHAGPGGNLRLEVLQELLGQINQHLRQLSTARDVVLDQGFVDAARLGVEPLAIEAARMALPLTQVANDAVRFVRELIAEDGLQLSDRLWRLDRGAREAVGGIVEQAVIQGWGASRTAEEIAARGEAVPGDIRDKANAARADRVARAAGRSIMTGEGNAHDNALRVARTELNRAHGEAYRNAVFAHPDAIGTKFLLSPGHPRRDICDMHATVNRWGLGPGVYPQGNSPWPAHPNTLSYEEIVFRDEVTPEDRDGKEDRIEWLKRQDPALQESVLGSRKKRAALERGILKENQIATPWKVLKERYRRAGVDVDGLTLKKGL